jgi:hypothetical protein
MPSLSTSTTEHKSGYILEVLCDQKPWGETYTYDEHFRCGPFKARMILAVKSVITDFVESEGEKPPLGVTSVADNDPWDSAFAPLCSTYDHFFVRRRRVDRPYLKLCFRRITYGFGVANGEALIVLMDKVKAFARSYAP